jgi:hypothetical protein
VHGFSRIGLCVKLLLLALPIDEFANSHILAATHRIGSGRDFAMALSDDTAGLAEVAAAIGRSPGWLQRNWLKLHEQENFPRKIPAGWVWPRRAVEVWLRSAGQEQARLLPANDDGSADEIEAAARALRQRYGATA